MGEGMKATDILQQYFGYTSFRPGQEEVIEALAMHRDVLAIMPTGAGKSLCFQIPALMSKGVTVVISPLLSLIKDRWMLCKHKKSGRRVLIVGVR